MLHQGQRIGVYEVIGPLGAGGMGEVYRARDTRLHREVAIKVLPAALAADPERMARFEREAQVLASLNHPHIATVYGFEEAPADQGSAMRALAMELVPGETLADRLTRGALTIPETVALATQIAAALEAAHDQGIIHRDLKPANIHVTPTGSVKVLDFGLAKLVAPAGTASSSSHSHSLSPTITSPAMGTTVGVLLGTAAYMSPEQAKGREAGPKSDVWAFGCVLFEMLTGRSPFKSDDVTETLAAILMREPEWSRLPAGLPINIERLLKRCLRRDLAQRLNAIGDARLELEDVPLPAHSADGPRVAAASRVRATAPWAIAAAAMVIALAVGVTWRMSLPAAAGSVRLSLEAPAGLEVSNAGETRMAISPDGHMIVVAYERAGVSQLFLRRLDRPEAVPIQGTERATNPFFSHDSRWIGFTQTNRLRKVAVDGGAPIDLAEATWGGGTWGPDDSVVYTPTYASGLWQVPAAGGSARKLTDPLTKDGELGHWWPQFLPDGKTVLLTNYRSRIDESRIEVLSLATGQRRTVLEHAVFGRYMATGHLLFMRSNTVFAVPFDLDRLVTTGTQTPVVDGVASGGDNGVGHFAVSPAGTLIYLGASELYSPSQLSWVTRAGTMMPVGFEPRRYGRLSVSPDERSVATSITTDGQTDVWIGDISRGTLRPLTDAPGSQFSPVWVGADGRRLVYASEEPAFHIYMATIGSAEKHELLVGGTYDAIPTSASADGQSIIFSLSEPETRGDILQLPLDAARKPRALVRGKFQEADGQLSPDGQWLAYTSTESGRPEVYIQDVRTGAEKIPVSNGGGEIPRWSADSRELFFRSGEQLMAVTVGGRPPLTVSRPTRLFEMRFQTEYTVARDGRFLVGLRDPQARPAQVRVVLNWLDELRVRAPVP